MKKFFKNWWNALKWEPGDPRLLSGGKIKITVVGGGTGLSNLLKGLKKYSNDISAIVAVSDDGKSSGILKKEFDMLPPGDIRKCISALAYDEKLISNIMEYRFKKEGGIFTGHTLGNIWIAALTKYFGSFEKAVEATTAIFESAGKVLPCTLQKLELCAEYNDKKKIVGESNIPRPGKQITKVYYDKKNVRPYAGAIEAIKSSDLIVIGPGSLYTSIIPNLLISGIARSIKENKKAVKVYISNCSTERGETEKYSVEDHIKAIYDHARAHVFDYCLANKTIRKKSKETSTLGKINNITTSNKHFLDCKIVLRNVVDKKNPLYHDSKKLAKEIIELYNEVK